MSKLISFAALFSSVGVAAAFDDAVIADARNGRVFAPFAMLMETEYGIPLMADCKGEQRRPIGKTAFLAISADYRADIRAGLKAAGIAAWGKRVAVGRALDLIAATMNPAADVIGDAAAWDALKPATKAKGTGTAKAAAGGVADTNSAAADEAGDDAPAGAQLAPMGVTLADAFPVVLAALQAGALSAVQRAVLVAALAETAPSTADAVSIVADAGGAGLMAAAESLPVAGAQSVCDVTGLPLIADDAAGNVFAMVAGAPLLLAAPVPAGVADAAPMFHAGADDAEPVHAGAMAQALAAAGVALSA